MPNINSIPEVLYEPNQPYHYHYDNLPLRNILMRIGLVNIQVDTNTDALRGAAGSAGTIGARLDASTESDGSLKTSAIDAAEHGIGSHKDGLGSDGVEYVRMKADERAKLALVGESANRLLIEIQDQFPTIGNYVLFEEGTLRLQNSSSVFFDFESPNTLKIHSAFPPETAHRHNYSLTPVHQNLSSPDYKNYRTTSHSTKYSEGSLRVYVNGVRLCGSPTPVPNANGTAFSQTYIVSESASTGAFEINRALSVSDVIRIDFDESFYSSSSSSSSSLRFSSSSSSSYSLKSSSSS